MLVYTETNKYFSKKANIELVKWHTDNIHHPYPTDEERIELLNKTGLTRKQLRIWLVNARRVKY